MDERGFKNDENGTNVQMTDTATMKNGSEEERTRSAAQMAQAIRDGALTSVELVQSCLDHIAQNEDRIGAFAFLDPDLALEQARRADEHRHRGLPTGALHGVPVAVKIFSTPPTCRPKTAPSCIGGASPPKMRPLWHYCAKQARLSLAKP